MLLRAKACNALAGALFETVIGGDQDWVFGFGRISLTVGCLWRIVDGGRVALAGSDHGQQFGLPSPVDAVAEARRRLLGRKIVEARIEPETADLKMLIEGGARLELMSDSSGYEAWTLNRTDSVIVSAGGRLTEARVRRSAS